MGRDKHIIEDTGAARQPKGLTAYDGSERINMIKEYKLYIFNSRINKWILVHLWFDKDRDVSDIRRCYREQGYCTCITK